ncbi:RNA 2',3'-cyclic phosphodiesterase [Varunaivibrio sulfuroxidans]|uniref:RNA 2',3'-cyclic phosphodiesterase n=1 Tax=Varunaivibrio sulfuroxidans TaxID=1773489 RepID=A0A4R3JG13_9PROT|nr:RNA 2',3'-cyclic phosphodiesterase [Varunaivibrio sulfuroxidans]TCS64797.1 2'-5' RNA ligase [Varunaivibrio sulfuroxidans]WES29899.1 RNA 2',3'-cyclic phosphodiesterase [Varunaivibrio sulfuroxidans]
MFRLFVAIGLPHPLPDGLDALRRELPGAKWVASDNLHLTLRFIGAVDESAVAEINVALATLSAPPLIVRPTAVGVFSRHNIPAHGHMAHTLWLGVEARPDLMALAQRIDALMAARGIGARERDFFPHVTLARLKRVREQDLEAYLARAGRVRVAPVAADRCTLYRSDQAEDGVRYVALRSYPLDGAAP